MAETSILTKFRDLHHDEALFSRYRATRGVLGSRSSYIETGFRIIVGIETYADIEHFEPGLDPHGNGNCIDQGEWPVIIKGVLLQSPLSVICVGIMCKTMIDLNNIETTFSRL